VRNYLILFLGGVSFLACSETEHESLKSKMDLGTNPSDMDILDVGINPDMANDFQSLPSATIGQFEPENNATNIKLDPSISAVFGQEMDETTIHSESVVLLDHQGRIVNSTINYDDLHSRLSILLPDSLLLLSKYRIMFKPIIRDVSGNSLGDISWSFTTVDGAWEDAKTVGPGKAKELQLKYTESGDAFAFWYKYDIGLIVSQFDKNSSTWGETKPLHTQSSRFYDLHIVSDKDGSLTLYWLAHESESTNDYKIWTTRFDAKTSSWRTSKMIPSDYPINYLNVASDEDGNTILLWEEDVDFPDSNLWAKRYNVETEKWDTPKLIWEVNDIRGLRPTMDLDENGDAIIAWFYITLGTIEIRAIRYRSSTSDWSEIEHIDIGEGPLFARSTENRISLKTKGGNTMIVWRAFDESENVLVWFTYYDPEKQIWSKPQPLETEVGFTSDLQLTKNLQGNMLASWIKYEEDQNRLTAWSKYYDISAQVWTDAKIIKQENSNLFGLNVKMDGRGNAIALWGTFTNLYTKRFNVFQQKWINENLIHSEKQIYESTLSLNEKGHGMVVWGNKEPDLGDNFVYSKRFR